MIVSTKGRYALQVMIYLAKHGGEEYISLKDIAENEEIPHKYLESIMTNLSKEGLVDGSRGKKGGYRLNRAPAEYNVAQIIHATENSISSVSCTSSAENPCPKSKTCATLPMWKALDENIYEFLSKYTLDSFV